MWPPSSSRNTGGGPSTPPPLGYGIPPELGMFVVAPAAFHHPAVTQHHHVDPMILPGDPHNNTHASNATTALGVGVNVIPLLTASPCLNNPTGGAIDESDIVDAANRGGRTGGGGGAIHLWQTQQQQQHNFTPPHEVNYLKKAGESISFDQNVHLFNSSAGGGSGLGGGLSGAGTLTCQDCGNQAKKDCSHRRCRTCCRSRGFDCSTHVKSTWVPAARRRERQVMTATRPSGGGGGDGASSGSTSGAKKPRLITSQNTTTTSHTSASNTPPRSYETSSSHQDASLKERLPGQVRAPAVFKCVRVSAVDDGSEDEYAYQAVVKIGGHVFKGFLYDQGMESREGFPNLSDLHVSGGGGCSSSRHGGGGVGPSPNNPLLDPSEVYGASASNAAGGDGAGILGGSTFGNTIG